ncbi:MAG TPA: DUF4249 family protein [Prolixibacteraceae bacterium]|nr:DUF4249 family protein [Prolixibacteraceae bacterium]
MRIIIPFLCFIIFLSCYRENIIEIEGMHMDEKLVVYSWLSPQTDSIFVSLTKTSSNFKQYFDTLFTLPEGTVIIKGNDKELSLKRISKNPALYGCSQNEFKIKSGIEYSLLIAIEGFDSVTAKTKVPKKCILTNSSKPICIIINESNGLRTYAYTFKTEFTSSDTSLETYNITTSCNGFSFILSPANDSTNRYRGFDCTVTDTLDLVNYSCGSHSIASIGSTNYIDFIIREDYVYNDNKGNSYYMPRGILYNKLTFYLYTYDTNHSASMNTLRLANELMPGNDIDELTSSSAIIPSYSNIEGGYGVFGSYVFDSISFNVSHDLLSQ